MSKSVPPRIYVSSNPQNLRGPKTDIISNWSVSHRSRLLIYKTWSLSWLYHWPDTWVSRSVFYWLFLLLLTLSLQPRRRLVGFPCWRWPISLMLLSHSQPLLELRCPPYLHHPQSQIPGQSSLITFILHYRVSLFLLICCLEWLWWVIHNKITTLRGKFTLKSHTVFFPSSVFEIVLVWVVI